MTRFLSLVAAAFSLAAGLSPAAPAGGPARRPVGYSVAVEGAIGPIAYHQVKRTLDAAAADGADFVLLTLDTPGGLLSSTRMIVKEILASNVPVIGYVSPRGSQCASAGTFIALSCSVLAMAPATNIGAAHPVTIGGGGTNATMGQKVENDTVSFIRSIAALRGKNADWAERAVRRSVSATERDAVAMQVADLVAADERELLAAVDGRTVRLPSGDRVLATAGADVRPFRTLFKDRILKIVSDPNIAYILLMVGIWGIIIEFSHPGVGLPGIVGTLCLVLAFFGLHTIPLNITGLILIVLGVVFYAIELVTPGLGVFVVAGTLSLLFGSFMLVKSPAETPIAPGLIWTTTVATAAIFLLIFAFVWRTRSRRVVTGKEGLVGETGRALGPLAPEGMVFVRGEIWKARVRGGALPEGTPVVVTGMEGMVLWVEEKAPSATAS